MLQFISQVTSSNQSKMKLLFFPIFLAIGLFMIAKAEEEELDRTDFCAKYGRRHTMCLSSPGPKCGSRVEAGLGFTNAEKKLMLDLHNEKRRGVSWKSYTYVLDVFFINTVLFSWPRGRTST